MRLFEIQQYTIYVDLDGTLVDFEKKALEVTGMHKTMDNMTPKDKRHFWGRVGMYEKNGGRFWEEMEPLPDMRELWGYIKNYNPTILTASGSVGDAPEEKRIWTKRHLGPHVPIIVVKGSADKKDEGRAHAQSILIDDASRAIDPWVAAGGIGILHKNAMQTILDLQKLGL